METENPTHILDVYSPLIMQTNNQGSVVFFITNILQQFLPCQLEQGEPLVFSLERHHIYSLDDIYKCVSSSIHTCAVLSHKMDTQVLLLYEFRCET